MAKLSNTHINYFMGVSEQIYIGQCPINFPVYIENVVYEYTFFVINFVLRTQLKRIRYFQVFGVFFEFRESPFRLFFVCMLVNYVVAIIAFILLNTFSLSLVECA